MTLLEDPTGTVVVTRLTTYLLLGVASASLAYYTAQNARRRTIHSEMWGYVILAGIAGGLYAITGTGEVLAAADVGSANIGFLGALRRLCQLFFIIFLALAMRELYFESPQHTGDRTTSLPVSIEYIRYIEAGLLFVAFLQFMAIILLGLIDVSLVVQLAASIGFTAYGVSFATRIRGAAMSTRTVLDTMLTYIIAVLLSAGGASAVEVGVVVGVQPAIVESLAVVLTVMSVTFLLVLTTRLKQNVADTTV
ncbi:hypothetical protein [Halohasta salina]|uniref:hypothetical protein n=1 Tax=Halohasta salina TaxID=2961621 RepID=UPI0020A3F198|nr:hypothetical protein [Halohasta salina]